MIERLDGFTADGFGNVIEGDPEAGDVIRIDGRIEQRYSPPPPPHVPDPTRGRSLTMGEFLKIGYGIGLAEQIDATLLAMPSLGLFLQQYLYTPGIQFDDAIPSQNPSTIRTAFARMKAAGFVDDAKITQFLGAWSLTYPEA